LQKRGIMSFGAYVPRRRLDRKTIAQANAWASPGLVNAARGARAMCAHDEDSITMAVAAGRAVPFAGAGDAPVAALRFASTTMPFADRLNATLIGEALSLPATIRTADLSGSLRSGVGALLGAIEAGGDELVIAADNRQARPGSPQELRLGDGAAAILVGSRDLIAEYMASQSVSVDFNDHYRSRDARFDYVLEERWARELGQFGIIPPLVSALLEKAGVAAADLGHCVFAHFSAQEAQAVAKRCGIAADAVVADLHGEVGDTGTAHPLLLLTKALQAAAPGELILLLGYGHGAEAILLRATDRIGEARAMTGADAQVASGVADRNYLRFLSFNGLLQMDWGMRAERDNRTAQSAFFRHRQTVTQAVGGRCTACGTPQFPRSRVCVNPECHATDTQEPEAFADKRATVKSFTEDWLGLSFNPPLMYGNIRFEGGGVAMLEFSDFEPGELHVGAPLELAFRIKDVDEKRGFRRYCWKAIPPRAATAPSTSQETAHG
jgi:3-hydroxy-3-methylglutaryl CoA synthase